MDLLPNPFPVPDWELDPMHYPTVFMIEASWAATPAFDHEVRSRITKALTGNTPLDTIKPETNHGEKTRQVICSLAKKLPANRVILVSMDRVNVLGNNFSQHLSNLPEALISVQTRLNAGDLVVINLGADSGQDSFSRDPLVAPLLNDIAILLGCIVVIAAGNTEQPLQPTLTEDVVVVGGVRPNGTVVSRFGSPITCYGVVPYELPDLPPDYKKPVHFDQSSAATAYTAGMVLMMLNYARSNGLTLTSRQVVGLLKANSRAFQVLSASGKELTIGSIADWNKLRPAIDVLADGVN